MNELINYTEPYRPQFHFSPARYWMNDPNGLVYYAGQYHLFFQHIPMRMSWMWQELHWGHAISNDLVHWKELPIALYPNQFGSNESGSAVVDMLNSSGFKNGPEDPIVIIYTSGAPGNTQNTWDALQQQSIAYSIDKGRTWATYAGNPVIPNPGLADFRDPKVFWHEESQKWVMILAAGDRVIFFNSTDLKSWVRLSEFGTDSGTHEGIWECPDLFPIRVEGEDVLKWVLLVSVLRGAPGGGSGTQYFIGSFDGQTFKNDNLPSKVLWLDYGTDNYAGGTWSNVPPADGRRLFIGWRCASNLAKTFPWKGAMTIVRELKLKRSNQEICIYQNPAVELEQLRENPIIWEHQTIFPNQNLFEGLNSKQFEIITKFKTGNISATEFGIKIRIGNGQFTIISYDILNSRLKVDLTRASNPEMIEPGLKNWHQQSVLQVDLPADDQVVSLRILVDWSSVEIFANDGQIVLTNSIFPDDSSTGLQCYAIGGEVACDLLAFYPLKSATSVTD